MQKRSTIYEVDEDVFQITTEHEDGRVTVETVFGQEAYNAHYNKEVQANGSGEHTSSLAGYFAEYAERSSAGRGASTLQ